MFAHAGIGRRIVGIVTLGLLLATYAEITHAQTEPGGSDEIAECLTDAWDRYGECLDDLPWYAELLCAARFSSDTVLCAPQWIIGKLK